MLLKNNASQDDLMNFLTRAENDQALKYPFYEIAFYRRYASDDERLATLRSELSRTYKGDGKKAPLMNQTMRMVGSSSPRNISQNVEQNVKKYVSEFCNTLIQ
jgi:hypothetical protein